jgi:hypothetical protein
MSKTTQKGFEMNLTVIEIGSIKPTPSGTFSDRDGKQIKYKGSVSFKCINIETVDDEDLGEKEVESALTIKIPCDNDSDIKPLNEYIRVLKERNKPFSMSTTIPRQADGSNFKSTSTLNSKEFILKMEKEIKANK